MELLLSTDDDREASEGQVTVIARKELEDF